MRGLKPFLVAAAAFAASASFAGDEPVLTDEDRADLAWLDGLGYPGLAGKPFVEVRQGDWQSVRGFVVDDDGARLRVVSTGFQEYAFERSPPGTPDDQRVVVEPLPLRELSEDWLAGGAAPSRTSQSPGRAAGPGEPSSRTQAFVCAWALYHGESLYDATLLHDLLAHARSMRPESWFEEDATKPFRVRVADDFAAAELLRAKMELAIPSWGVDHVRSRAEQLDAFRAVLRRFPATSSEAEARKFADVLERMTRDDAAHAKSAKPLESLAGDERRRELVFRLREQQADGHRIYGGPGDVTDGPYVELVKDEAASVPALLDALADDSFTRVGSDGRSGRDPVVESVQDLALQALEAIAGRAFRAPDGWSFEKDGPWPRACRPSVEAWYAEVKAVGEVESLVRAVEKGDEGSEQAAKLLASKDAARVPAALVRALAVPNQQSAFRSRLLALLAKHPGDVGLDLVRKEATSGESRTRLDAATLLADAGDAAAPDALLALWRERRDDVNGRYGIEELRTIVGALVALRRVDVVRALAEDLPKRGVLPRRAVVETFAAARAAATGECAVAMDAALADALFDRTERDERIYESEPAEGLTLRVNDVAAAALAASRGLAQPVLADSFADRDAKVAAVAAACGRSVPASPTPSAPVVDADVVKARFDAFAATASDARDDMAARVRDIEALGLGAVPTLLELLPRAEAWHASTLRPSIARLNFVVRAVRFVPEGRDVAPGLKAKIDALVGLPLTAAAFADAAWMIVGTRDSASLDADRGADGTGVVVTLTMCEGHGAGWTFTARAIRAGRWVDRAIGSGWSCDPPGDDGRTWIAHLVEPALSAQPNERVRLHVTVERRPADE